MGRDTTLSGYSCARFPRPCLIGIQRGRVRLLNENAWRRASILPSFYTTFPSCRSVSRALRHQGRHHRLRFVTGAPWGVGEGSFARISTSRRRENCSG